MSDKPLNARQQLFVAKYAECLNATQAAIQAGYSEKTARSQGARLLTNVDITTLIEEQLASNVMGRNEVLSRLTEIGRADIEDIMSLQGNLPFVDMQKAQEAAKTGLIKKIKITKSSIEFELHDKMRALEMLGKFHALFTENIHFKDLTKLSDDELRALAEGKGGG